jgi:hypothetical protein
MRASRRSLALVLGALAAVAVLAMSGNVLAAAPVLLLCAVLGVLGYVGEERIERLRSRRARLAPARGPASIACARPVRVMVVRGAALLSAGRAVRPPPAVALVA